MVSTFQASVDNTLYSPFMRCALKVIPLSHSGFVNAVPFRHDLIIVFFRIKTSPFCVYLYYLALFTTCEKMKWVLYCNYIILPVSSILQGYRVQRIIMSVDESKGYDNIWGLFSIYSTRWQTCPLTTVWYENITILCVSQLINHM